MTFKYPGYRALSLCRFVREHDLQTRLLSILEQSDIDSNDSRNREQFLIVIAQDGVDVALWRRRIILRHMFSAADGEDRETNKTYRPRQSA
jgi:hypothetical protein